MGSLPANVEPRAAYVHVPFCAHRCGYCNFTLIAGRDDLIDRYLTALDRELSLLEQPREVDTLFLGGGTPSHLSPEHLQRLLSIVQNWFPLAAGGEFSVEANPSDIDSSRVKVFAAHGVNRVSLGVQSFNKDKLEVLERDHHAESVTQAVQRLQARGLDVSLDLIFAAPGETLRTWRDDLAAAIDLSPVHLSTYGLTYERGAQFWSKLNLGELTAVHEDMEREMYIEAIETLGTAGYEHYEVSNFARHGHRCRHNEVYWRGDEYFAAGPGAARYVSGRREVNHRSTTTWMKRVLDGVSAVAESETLGPEDRAREALVLAMRRLEGVQRPQFAERYGFEVESLVGPRLSEFLRLGLFEIEEDRLRLTRKGLLISDSLWPELLRV